MQSKKVAYSLVWEDAESVINSLYHRQWLIVCSGGCQILHALLTKPQSVVAIDNNQAQLHLLELKLAAIKILNYKAFSEFIGLTNVKPSKERIATFKLLESGLSKEAFNYWYQHQLSIERGILHCGKFERYIALVRKYILPIILSKTELANFLTIENSQEQFQWYNKNINSWRYKLFFKLFFGRKLLSSYGRNKVYYKHSSNKTGKTFAERFNRSWLKVLPTTNPFIHYLIQGHFSKRPLPHWAKESNFLTLKQYANRVKFVHASVDSYLKEGKLEFDEIYLSNICEAMSNVKSRALFQHAAKSCKTNGHLTIWNNTVERKPESDEGWLLNSTESERYWKSRKSAFYGFMGIYNRK